MKRIIAVAIALFSMITVAYPVRADWPAPGGPWSSIFRIENQTVSIVKCMYTIYNSLGQVVYYYSTGQDPNKTYIITLNPKESKLIQIKDLPLDQGMYSDAITCDGKVAVVSNVSDINSGSSFLGGGSVASTLYAPGLYDNYYNYYSNITVQNVSDLTQDISLEVYAPNYGLVHFMILSGVTSFQSVNFDLKDTPLAANQTYSGVIRGSGGGKITSVVNIYGLSSITGQLYSYNAFTNGNALTYYAPLVMKNYYGYNSALVIQNLGTLPTTVTVTYSPGPSHQAVIGPYSAWSIYVPSQGPAELPSGPNGLFSAKAESTTYNGSPPQPIALLSNMSNSYNRAASYTGVTGGFTEIYAPNLDRRYSSFNSSVTCQNMSGVQSAITIDFYDGDTWKGNWTSPPINNESTVLFYSLDTQHFPFLYDGWHGSARLYSPGSFNCVVTQDMNEAPQSTTFQDELYAYEGVP